MTSSKHSRKKETKGIEMNHDQQSLIAPCGISIIKSIELTYSQFLDMYSKSKWNLSKVPCPPCIKTKGFMVAPESYTERIRAKETEPFLELPHWDDSSLFKPIASRIRKDHKVAGLTISLIHKTKVHVKHETRMHFSEVPRSVSLDSHAILSKDSFYLLDASKDWRTARNPFVVGRPNIRLYCGVRLMSSKNEPIGILAVFDTWARTSRSESMVRDLQAAAKEIMKKLNTPYEQILRDRKHLENPTRANTATSEVDEGLKQLSLKLGRATSRVCPVTVFEKDGSGNPYSQNNHFTSVFAEENEDTKSKCVNNTQKKTLFRMMSKVRDMRKASELMCETIAASFKADFVFIMEIRSAELYSIDSEYFPKGVTKIDTELFKYAHKLVKNKRATEGADKISTRVLGTHGATYTTVKADHDLFMKAFSSDFGVHYTNAKKSTKFNSGIIMPFYRYNSKLVKKSSKNSNPNVVEVYLRAGGYLVGVMLESTERGQYSPSSVSKIFDHMSLLRKIYIA
ncbi:hypothetical protein CJJ07_003441 [Candidozyma auris]|nr:hypothetical protein CJJ07_003441 [[Candida] auris]QEL61337.1 hypothetical protein CJJ09_003477 [[Candida] auris]